MSAPGPTRPPIRYVMNALPYTTNDSTNLLQTPHHSPSEAHPVSSTGSSRSLGTGVSCAVYNNLVDQHNDVLNKYNDLQQRDMSPRLLTLDPNVRKDIIRTVKQDLFKKVKFITSQKTLDDITTKGSIGQQIIERFNVATTDQEAFWNTYKHDVRKALNSKRNEVQTSIQKAVRAMFEASKEPDQTAAQPEQADIQPKVDYTKVTDVYQDMQLVDILELRRNVNDAYEFVFDCIFRCIVGKTQWKGLIKGGGTVSQIVTVSDEAFCLLVLENGWDKWEKIVSNGVTCPKQCRKIKSKYSIDVREGNAAFDGWSVEGLTRYNALAYQILDDREHNGDFDTLYIDKLGAKNGHAARRVGLKCNDEKIKQREMIETFNEYTESVATFKTRFEQETTTSETNGRECSERESEEDSENEESSDSDNDDTMTKHSAHNATAKRKRRAAQKPNATRQTRNTAKGTSRKQHRVVEKVDA